MVKVKTTVRRAALALGLLGAAAGVVAQYKHVGPDGRVTYSDRPLPGATAGTAARPEALPGPDEAAGQPAPQRLTSCAVSCSATR